MTIRESIQAIREKQDETLQQAINNFKKAVQNKMTLTSSEFYCYSLTEEKLNNRNTLALITDTYNNSLKGSFPSENYSTILASFEEASNRLYELGIKITLDGDSINWEFFPCKKDWHLHNAYKDVCSGFENLRRDLQHYWILEDEISKTAQEIVAMNVPKIDSSIQVCFTTEKAISYRLLTYLEKLQIQLLETDGKYTAYVPLNICDD